MRAHVVLSWSVGLAVLCHGPVLAQEKTDTKAIEAELDQFRDGLFHAFNKGEYKQMLEKYCHKDVIATWQDGTTSKGHDEVLAEFDKLHKFIAKMTVDPNTDKRLILNDGKVVIATGNMKDKYVFTDGREVTLNSRWEATLIDRGGKEGWLLVAFAASTNAFDNPVVDLYLQKTKYTYGGAGAGVGLVVGIVLTLLIARRRSS